jgi:hypothetical protein
MGLSRIGLLLMGVGLAIAPSFAQSRLPRCLHGDSETQVQAQRRVDALDASDLIIRILDRHPRGSAYPTWEELAKSPRIESFRGIAGRRGEVARKMQWGGDEPLPGWRIHYVAAQDGYAFALSDLRDPCQLTFAANDTGMLIEGQPADLRGRPRVIPLDSTQ